MASSRFFLLSLLFVFILSSHRVVSAKLVLEDGYIVSTVIDGHKLGINPHSIRSGRVSSDLVLLDSVKSVFYTVSLPLSPESEVKPLSGDGSIGHSDGELGSARFSNPKSFAVDFKGNAYVADKKNHAIRKISSSGVTTIAGGFSKKEGKEDGPAQNATFSNDFEVVFIPEICALLISDHGNMLVRQIDLKAEDCRKGSTSALGAVLAWVVGLGLSCLLGFVIGFAVRPFMVPHEGSSTLHCRGTWKPCLINLVKQVEILCFGIKNAVASSALYALMTRLFWLSLSHLTLIFRVNNVESQTLYKSHSSSLDCGALTSNKIQKSGMFADQLKDLISFDDGPDLLSKINELPHERDDGDPEETDVLPDFRGSVDNMIRANIIGFVKAAKETTQSDGSLLGSAGLVKRRLHK